MSLSYLPWTHVFGLVNELCTLTSIGGCLAFPREIERDRDREVKNGSITITGPMLTLEQLRHAPKTVNVIFAHPNLHVQVKLLL
jgi:acyl-CoA synthetase (AMP-forming)/AMP-acid ligase II